MPNQPPQNPSPTTFVRDGRTFTSFAGCNYLGLAQYPAVIAALARAAAEFGLSTTASRLTTGNLPIYERLERAIAGFVGTPDAVLLLDGFTANIAAVQVMAGQPRRFVVDARAHASLHEAVRFAGAPCEVYPHRDIQAAAALLNASGPAPVLATDSVFAADGALAPICELLASARDPRTLLLLDDCHGFGVLGPGGRGGLAHAALPPELAGRTIITGTLAKAIGCHGGFIAASAEFCRLVRQRASVYGTTTPPPPPIAAAALEAIAILHREPDRLERLHQHAAHLRRGLRSLGLSLIDTPAPIFAFTLEDPARMVAVERSLLGDGYIAPIIAYPGGPAERYFRLSVTSEHMAGQIDELLAALERTLAGFDSSR